MQDHRINSADYGKDAQSKDRRKSSKGFGKPSNKGKRNETPKGRGKQQQDTVVAAKTPRTTLRVTTFAAFARDCNTVMHALNRNYTWYCSPCPRSHSQLWRESFFLPNGMLVFRFAFYSKDSLGMHVYRTGFSFEIETSRRESPTLYGITRRAVASNGGEPGSRRHLLQHYGSMPPRYHRASDDDTYLTTHLHYGGVQDTGRDDSSHPTYLHYEGREPRELSGYQHRSAHGGVSTQYRGQRSADARERRFHRWVEGRRTARQDYRLWKRSLKDSTLRVHGGLNPLPPIHPKPTYVERHYKNIKQARGFSLIHPINHSRSIQNSLTVPLPTPTHLRIMSWNVERLKETAKSDSIIQFCSQHRISLLRAQETKVESSLMSYAPPNIMAWASSFLPPFGLMSPALSHIPPRICELTIATLPHPITIINIYAPSTVDTPETDREQEGPILGGP